jgi:hypothetical protein
MKFQRLHGVLFKGLKFLPDEVKKRRQGIKALFHGDFLGTPG